MCLNSLYLSRLWVQLKKGGGGMMKLWEKRVILLVALGIFSITSSIVAYVALSIRAHTEEMHNEMQPTIQMVDENAQAFMDSIESTAETVRVSVARVLKHSENVTLSAEVVVQTATETSENMKLVLRLLGLEGEAKEKSTLTYVVSLVEFVRESRGTIALAKVWGNGLDKDGMYSAIEWADGERAELFLLVLASNTRAEILEKFCRNTFGRPWLIIFENQKPIDLKVWISQHHPETISYARLAAKEKH